MKLSCFSDCITGSLDVFSALTLLHISAALDIADTSSFSQRSLLCTGSAFPGTPSPSPWGSFAACAPPGSVWSHLSSPWCPLLVTVDLYVGALLGSRQLLLTLPPGGPPGFLTQPVLKPAPEASASHPPRLAPKSCPPCFPHSFSPSPDESLSLVGSFQIPHLSLLRAFYLGRGLCCVPEGIQPNPRLAALTLSLPSSRTLPANEPSRVCLYSLASALPPAPLLACTPQCSAICSPPTSLQSCLFPLYSLLCSHKTT